MVPPARRRAPPPTGRRRATRRRRLAAGQGDQSMSLRQGCPASRRAAAWPLAGLLTTVSLLALTGGARAADATDAAMATADTSPTAVGAVVVTAAPREEVAARAVQLDAPNEVRVQSAETIL